MEPRPTSIRCSEVVVPRLRLARGGRIVVLERFIEHVLATPGARFSTCGAVAHEFRLGEGRA